MKCGTRGRRVATTGLEDEGSATALMQRVFNKERACGRTVVYAGEACSLRREHRGSGMQVGGQQGGAINDTDMQFKLWQERST